ncbi:MAG TPA: hypothetical protein VJH23_05865 [archaeon]|nr:hypothetical protein [archaeon]
MLGRKKKEGKPIPETSDMKMWREEFKEMKLEDHDKMLKNLGLDEEDIAEFNEVETKGKKLEDLLGLDGDGQGAKQAEPESAKKKKK